MAIAVSTHMLAVIVGIIGNITSFLVYLSPLPTFTKIYRRRSTEGYHSFPYAVALFSAMLYLYYALLKEENGIILITINSVGFIIESAYLVMYMMYATPASRVHTARTIIALNLGAYVFVILLTSLAFKGESQVNAVGWSCAAFSVCVFASPLSIIRKVIRTRSVRYMPLMLSVMLTFCAVVWFFYGFLINDYFIAFPNILGFILGIAQIVLYNHYKGCPDQNSEQELPTTAHPFVNGEQPIDARSVNGTGGRINEPGYNVMVENAVDNDDEFQGDPPIIIKVMVMESIPEAEDIRA